MQTYFKHGMGDTIALYFEIFKNNIGQTGETPVVAVQKNSTNEWLNATKDNWHVSYNELTMVEPSSGSLPGVYTLDITHIDSTAETYNCYFKNGGTNAPGNDFEAHYFTGAVYVPANTPYATGSVLGTLDIMRNKDGSRTFDQSTDSLEAISDTGLSVTNLGDIADAVWDEPHAEHVDPASTGYMLSAGGTTTGNNIVTINIEDIGTLSPIPDTFIRINSPTGLLLDRGYSDGSGNYTTALDNGTYQVVLRKSFYDFTVPETLTVSGSGTFTFAGSGFSPTTPSTSGDTCVVYGWVVDVGGSPVRNAVITAVETDDSRFSNTQKVVKLTKYTKSDINGYYELELLRSGTLTPEGIKYKITMTYPGFTYETHVLIPNTNVVEFSTLV